MQLEISEEFIDQLAEAIASRLNAGANVSSSDEVTKEMIEEWFDNSDLTAKDVKATLKEYSYKTVSHIDEDEEEMSQIFDALKALVSDEPEETDEVDLDLLEVGVTATITADGDEYEGEIEKLTKKFVVVDGDKLILADITAIEVTEAEKEEVDEEVTMELVKEALQAYKAEFGNDEYKSLLKEAGIKKLTDLKNMEQEDLESLYSEIVE